MWFHRLDPEMKQEARKIWKSPQGASLLDGMLKGEPPKAQAKATLERLKKAHPPAKLKG